jgi:hypothetical protein
MAAGRMVRPKSRKSDEGEDASMDIDPEAKAEAQRKLFGRAMVVGFLLLIAVYVAATFWPH